jgi:hypothetical protein
VANSTLCLAALQPAKCLQAGRSQLFARVGMCAAVFRSRLAVILVSAFQATCTHPRAAPSIYILTPLAVLAFGAQFPEDNGPMAHPIRPESYIVMDNFYTDTVYDKGAEVWDAAVSALGCMGG